MSKYRRKVLMEGIAERLKHIITEVCQGHQAERVKLEVMPDHVHVLVDVILNLEFTGLCGSSKVAHRGSYGRSFPS